MLPQRRDVLRGLAAGGLVVVAPLAGCTGQSDGDNGSDGSKDEPSEQPAYHRYMPAQPAGKAGTGVRFFTLDTERYRELGGGDLRNELPKSLIEEMSSGSGQGGDSDNGAGADPLLAFSGSGLFAVPFVVTFGLVPYRFHQDVLRGIDPSWAEEGSGKEDSPHRIDTVVTWPGAVVFQGDIDSEAIVDQTQNFEQIGERDGFAVYEGIDIESSSGPETPAFAVNETQLIVNTATDASMPPASIEDPIDVVVGNAERLSEDDDGDWAISTAGHGLSTTGLWGEGGSATALSSTKGFISSLTVGDEQVQSTLAAVYHEGETPDRGEIEAELGPSATDIEIGIDERRVDVTATYPVESRRATTMGGDGTPTSTAPPEPEYEVWIDERVNDKAEYTRNLDAGTTLRLSVDHNGEGQMLVYMSNDDGDVLLNDATASSATWEVEITQDNQFFVEAYLSPADADGWAMVTIEVREG